MTTAPVAIITTTTSPSQSQGSRTPIPHGPSPVPGRLSPYSYAPSRGPSPAWPPTPWQAPPLSPASRSIRPIRPERPPSLFLDVHHEDPDTIHAISTDVRESRYKPVLGDFGPGAASPLRLSPVRPEDLMRRMSGSWRNSVYKSGGSF
jgi:hypothetical protein